MRQAHEVVIPFYRIPILGKGMFIGVALVFFDQKAAFDPPAVAGAEVTAGMQVQAVERATGKPGMFCRLGNDRQCVGIKRFPLFAADAETKASLKDIDIILISLLLVAVGVEFCSYSTLQQGNRSPPLQIHTENQ